MNTPIMDESDQIAQLKAELSATNKACAEMRQQLSRVFDMCCDEDADWDHLDADAVKHALASDCGRDYVPRSELEKETSRRQHTQEWYSSRLERLSDFIRDEIPEPQKTRYFSIIANGASDVFEPNTYEACSLAT